MAFGTCVVQRDTEVHIHPLSWLQLAHILQGKGVVVLILHAGIITVPIYHDAGVEILALGADSEVVLLLQTIVEHQVFPFVSITITAPVGNGLVVVHIAHLALLVLDHQSQGWRHQLATLAVAFHQLAVGIIVIAHPVEIVFLEFQLFGCITPFIGIIVGAVGRGNVGIEVNGEFFRLRLLGGDDDNSIGSPGSIDCRCCRILEYRDLIDLILVDICQCAADRQSIYHDKRTAACLERTNASDGHCAVIIDKACHLALQTLLQTRHVSIVDFLGRNHLERTSGALLLQGLITRHHYVAELLGIVFHYNGNMLVGNLAPESFHADIGVFQHGILGNVIHLIFTILIGYCAHTATSHLDRNSDERISITVEYLSAHLTLLGIGLLRLAHNIDT